MNRTIRVMCMGLLAAAFVAPAIAQAQCNEAQEQAYDFLLEAADAAAEFSGEYETDVTESHCNKFCKSAIKGCGKGAKAALKGEAGAAKTLLKIGKVVCSSVVDSAEKADCKDQLKEAKAEVKEYLGLEKADAKDACTDAELADSCLVTCNDDVAPPESCEEAYGMVL